MTDEAADRIRLPQKWYIIKIRGNKRKATWSKQEDKINNPTYYDENGTRIKFDEDYSDDEEEEEGEEDGEDGDDDDNLKGANNGEYDEGEEGDNSFAEDGEEDEDDYERRMEEKNQAFLDGKNARILEINKREEDNMIRKQFDKKKGRNVLVRTLSGDFEALFIVLKRNLNVLLFVIMLYECVDLCESQR